MSQALAAMWRDRKRAASLPMVLFAILLWSLAGLGKAAAEDAGQASVPPTAGSVESLRAAAQALQDGWLVAAPPYGATWVGINAWQRFVIVDALAQYTEITGDRTYLPQVERAVANHDGLDGNDDDLWAVIASLLVYRIDRSPALLAFSRAKFGKLTERYWDETCGGGMWWDHQRTYKNAITNELLLDAATALYGATGEPVYLAWAHKEWAWFRQSKMINSDNLVNDGLNAQCQNNGGATYTYNQGVILGGLIHLGAIDGDRSHVEMALAIAQAVLRRMTVAGVLEEPVKDLNQDGQTFKGVFVYYLGDLVPLAADPKVREALSCFLVHNAESVWSHREQRENRFDAYWAGTPVVYGAAAQAAGLELLSAAFRATGAAQGTSSPKRSGGE